LVSERGEREREREKSTRGAGPAVEQTSLRGGFDPKEELIMIYVRVPKA